MLASERIMEIPWRPSPLWLSAEFSINSMFPYDPYSALQARRTTSLSKIHLPTLPRQESYVQHSRHFVLIRNQFTISEDDILVCSDTESLFTRDPTHDTLEIVREHMTSAEDLFGRTEHCVTSTFFVHQGKFYRQGLINVHCTTLLETILNGDVYWLVHSV
jgi:hypothetical protein